MTDRNGDKKVEPSVLAAREIWHHRGQTRPAFADTPGPGCESVWDYPRPPAVVADPRHIIIRLDGETIAETETALRVLETASPPTFYLPAEDIHLEGLERAAGTSFCEWKGAADYYDVLLGSRRLRKVAWSYPNPFAQFLSLRGRFAFYPQGLECFVADERVRPQAGGFYGGWVTDEIAGPWKGAPGSGDW